MSTIVCVGAGIVGVFAALRARQLRPNARVLLVEQDDAIGGLLRSDTHPNGLSFDRGTHILSETGQPEIDDLLFSHLDSTRWGAFAGASRDLSGLLLDQTIQETSPYLDASRETGAQDGPACIGRGVTAGTLQDYLYDLHGAALSDRVFRRPIWNLYQRDLNDLAPFAARQLPLARIVRDDMATWLENCHDPAYRAWIACPDQKCLPAQYANARRTFYPRRMGIGQLFASLLQKLASSEVEVRLSTTVSSLDRGATGTIEHLGLKSKVRQVEILDGPLDVIWAATPFPLPQLLMCAVPPGRPQTAWTPIVADFCAKTVRKLDCFYYIDYGAGDGFRLTNYSAFCNEACSRDASPFTFEIWWRQGEPDAADVQSFVTQRMMNLGIITQMADVTDFRLRRTQHGILLPSLTNMAWLEALAGSIRTESPANFVNVGLLSREGLFFTGDMLSHAEASLREAFA